MPVDAVFLGEVVCSKRAPLFEPYLAEVAARLQAAGKEVVFSTLAEVTSAIDRRLVEKVATADGFLVEANDASALWHLGNRPHAIGPYINVYNEETLEHLAARGAVSICLPPEMPASGIAALAPVAQRLGVGLEVQVHGRMPLALSARCYHARAHGRTKDSCQFACDEDPDGMVLRTLDDKPMLVVNGIQTLSHTCLNLLGETARLRELGISRLRVSPQSCGTGAVVRAFRELIDGRIDAEEANVVLETAGIDAPFSNGFFHQRSGIEWRLPDR